MTRSAIALIPMVGVLAVCSVTALVGEEQLVLHGVSVLVADEPEEETSQSLKAKFAELMHRRAAAMSDDELRQAIEKESRAVVEADAQRNLEQAMKMVRRAMHILIEVSGTWPETRAGQEAQRIETVLRHAVTGKEILIRGQR